MVFGPMFVPALAPTVVRIAALAKPQVFFMDLYRPASRPPLTARALRGVRNLIEGRFQALYALPYFYDDSREAFDFPLLGP